MADKTIYRLALIGFGAVGQGLAQILRYHSDWLAQRYGVVLRIVAVCTRDRGSLYDTAGIDPAILLEEIERVGHLRELAPQSGWEARGMHVVTANKGPIALHFAELRRQAMDAGVYLGFEGSVMSGTPALRLAWSDLAGCEILELNGI